MRITDFYRNIMSSSRFNRIIKGEEFIIPSLGEKVFLKVAEIKKSIRPKGYRFSKHSFLCQTFAEGVTSYGYGESEIELLAIQKAIAEGVERTIFRIFKNNKIENIVTSNGWAAQITEKRTRRAALEELLERDAILMHWLTESPVKQVSNESLPSLFSQWVNSELSLSPRFNILKVGTSIAGFLPSVSVALFDDDGYAVISHATDLDFNTAISKALAECCRIAQMASEGHFNESSKSLIDGGEGVIFGPHDHAMVYAYHKKFPTWYFGAIINWEEANNDWSSRFSEFKRTSIPHEFILAAKGPLIVGYVLSSSVQNLFVGPIDVALNQKALNFNRIRSIKPDFVEPYRLPHCVP
jgi:hypothetical protein